MLGKLLKKEFCLCIHPAAPLMLLLSALTLVPNYPYGVMYFYLTLGFFFICLNGRENHDIVFSMTLPISRRDIAAGRIGLFVTLELIHLVLAGIFVLLHSVLLPNTPNAAGMDANIVLIANGFLYYSVFHLVFLPAYYRDVNKVGTAFIKSSAAIFLLVIMEIVCTYAVPFVRDVLDTPDPAHMGSKIVFLAVCAVIYAAVLVLSFRISVRRFSGQDIR